MSAYHTWVYFYLFLSWRKCLIIHFHSHILPRFLLWIVIHIENKQVLIVICCESCLKHLSKLQGFCESWYVYVRTYFKNHWMIHLFKEASQEFCVPFVSYLRWKWNGVCKWPDLTWIVLSLSTECSRWR